jgi:hypothetical protein
MKRYPDKSHQRRKEREAAEKVAVVDRLCNVEEALKRQQINSTDLASKVLAANLSGTW